jgi:hypothetical protein
MSSNSNCCCGGNGTTSVCESTVAELPRYYPRQLITPDDLTLEQDYFRDRLRRHNRLLHGWGVVCGALVCPATTSNSDGTTSPVPYNVIVQTGYIFGPYGDEIILDCQRTVDVRTSGVSGVTGEPCLDGPDPWCTQVYTAPPAATNTVYIAVQYKQSMMRPVRVQPVGCGCSDTTCEFSRWHDGYEIGVLTQCPPCNQSATLTQGLRPLPGGTQTPVGTNLPTGGIVNNIAGIANPTCPNCSCGPWVGLAMVTFGSDGTITGIDNCVCRRIVVSYSQVYRTCSGATTPSVNASQGAQLTLGATNVAITVTGSNFVCGATASFDSILTVSQTEVQDSQTLNLTVSVNSSVPPGSYSPNLTVQNMDTSTSSGVPVAVTVAAAPSASATSGAAQPAARRVKPSTQKPASS